MKFYDIRARPGAYPRWYLKFPVAESGERIDERQFTCGEPYFGPRPRYISLRRKGPHVDFVLADSDMIVVPRRLNDVLVPLIGSGRAERWPVRVEDEREPMEILNLLDVVDCIDMRRSDYDVRNEDCRPTLDPQQIRGFGYNGMVIDPERASGHKLFRPKGWKIAPVCDDDVRSLLEKERISGIAFKELALSPDAPLNQDYSSNQR